MPLINLHIMIRLTSGIEIFLILEMVSVSKKNLLHCMCIVNSENFHLYDALSYDYNTDKKTKTLFFVPKICCFDYNNILNLSQ